MRLDVDSLTTKKSYVHMAQGGLLALSMILMIALFTRDGHSDGGVIWYFVLCWLTIPALIYLAMVPLWSRARRLSNVYAFACLDGFFAVFWLSAWAAMAAYVVAGKGQGTNTTASGCDNFAFGSPGRCKLAQGNVVLGVFIMLLFIPTTVLSLKAVMDYARTGQMPRDKYASNDFSAHTREAFSSNMGRDEFDDDPMDARSGRYGHAYKPSVDDDYVAVQQVEPDDISQMQPTRPGGPLNYGTSEMREHNQGYRDAHPQH